MEEAGWVERRADPNDRRVWRIFLTEKAQPVLVELEKIAIEVRDDAMIDFSLEERERFIDDLIKVKSNLSYALRRDEAAPHETMNNAPVTGGRFD